jgi:hypothetical protein
MSDETWDGEEDFDPEEVERQIDGFIAAADDLPGPAVVDLAGRVAEVLRATSAQLDGVLAGVAHNKVLATQLLLSQRARQLTPDDPDQWQLFAASTLLSGRIASPEAPAPD